MKKYLFLLLIAFCLVGCKSKEEKAEELINKAFLENNLSSFGDVFYEFKINNIQIKKALDVPINSPDCWNAVEPVWFFQKMFLEQQGSSAAFTDEELKEPVQNLYNLCKNYKNRDKEIGWDIIADIEAQPYLGDKICFKTRFIANKDFTEILFAENLNDPESQYKHYILTSIDNEEFQYQY